MSARAVVFLQRKKNLFNIYVSFYRIAYVSTHSSLKCRIMLNMAIRVVEFSSGGTILERFLPKNQHTRMKLLNFKNWVNGKLLKIGHHFSDKGT